MASKYTSQEGIAIEEMEAKIQQMEQELIMAKQRDFHAQRKKDLIATM